MKWTDLVNEEINILVSDKEKLKKKLDKIRGYDNEKEFDKKVSLMAEMKAIDVTINRLYILLGKANLVDE